jgi:hypothetical protein
MSDHDYRWPYRIGEDVSLSRGNEIDFSELDLDGKINSSLYIISYRVIEVILIE